MISGFSSKGLVTFNPRLALLLALVVSAIALGTQTGPPTGASMAITDVTLLDSTGRAAQPHMTVVIADGRITNIAPSGRFRPPAAAGIIDGTGKFLIPGLWDMHVHLGNYEEGKKELARLLDYGITGVRDMASPVDDILRLRQDTSVGSVAGARMIVAGPILQGPLPFRVPPLVRTVSEANDAKKTVDELKAKGVDFIKIGDTLLRDLYVAIAEESKRLRIPFVGHLPVSVTASEASRYGQRSIEHLGSAGFHGVLIACSTQESELSAYAQQVLSAAMTGGDSPDTKLLRADFTTRLVDGYDSSKAAILFSLFVKNGTWQVPTLIALRSVWDSKSSQMTAADIAAGERVWQKDMEMVAAMTRAGVKILAGTDLPVGDGVPALYDELALLVQAGLSPMQALQAATRSPAEFMGRLSDIGTIERGKIADLVLVDANPLLDIRNAQRVDTVILAGRLVHDRRSTVNPSK